MKLNAPTKDFRDVLARLSILPGASSGIPVTQVIKFEADAEGLKMSRFSSEASISITLETVAVEVVEGCFSANHSSLVKMAGKLPAKSLILENDEKHLRMISGKANARLNISKEFQAEPPEPELETDAIRLPLEMLAKALDFVSEAMHRDESQKGFTGLCLRMMGDRLAFIASDKKRIHIQYFADQLPVDCILSGSAVETLKKVIGQQAGACTLAIGENTMTLLSHDTELTVALLNESFPNVLPMITHAEGSERAKIIVDREEFVETIKQVGGIGTGEARFVSIDFGLKELTITATDETDPDNPELKMTMACKATKAERCRIGAAQAYAGLSHFSESEDVELVLYSNILFVQESSRVAVFALQFDNKE